MTSKKFFRSDRLSEARTQSVAGRNTELLYALLVVFDLFGIFVTTWVGFPTDCATR